MKRFLKGLIPFLLLCLCTLQTVSAADIKITLNGRELTFDAALAIENGRVLVPMRGVLESLGYTVQWQEPTKTVLAVKDSMEISMPLNSNTISETTRPSPSMVPQS